MRIAVANWSRRRAGGVETYLAEVIPELQRRGHEIALISELDEPADRQPIASQGLALDVCAQSIGTTRATEMLADWNPDVIYLHQMQDLEMERRVSESAPVVAFAHAYYGTCISGTKTHRLPSVHPCTRTLGPGCLVHYFPHRCGGLNPLTMMQLYRQQTWRLEQMRRYFRVVTFSDHMAREYAHHGIEASKLWIEKTTGEPAEPILPPGPGEPWRLMFLGRFELLKGIEVLLGAVSILSEEKDWPVVLTLVGDGSDRARIERDAAAITAGPGTVSIEFTGWLTGDVLEREWERAHALVMPSIWPEPFGLAGIEAGRRKLPVAAFSVGAIPEWLTDGVNGVLAELRGNLARNLAQALNRLMADSSLYSRMSSEAPRMAARFSMENHIDLLTGVLDLAASSTSGRPH